MSANTDGSSSGIEDGQKTEMAVVIHGRRRQIMLNTPMATALTLALVSLSACTSCSSPSDSPGADQSDAGLTDAADASTIPDTGHTDGQDATAQGDGASDGSHDGAKDATSDVDPVAAKYVPAGWKRWWGWSKECPLWYPGDSGKLPKIHWEPCNKEIELPSGVACEKLMGIWGDQGGTDLRAPMFKEPSTGKWMIPYREFPQHPNNPDLDFNYQAFYDVEGNGHVGFMVSSCGGTTLYPQPSAGVDRWLFRGDGDLKDAPVPDPKEYTGGYISGHFGERLPDLVYKQKYRKGTIPHLLAAKDWFIQRRWHYKARTWDRSTEYLVYDLTQDPHGAIIGTNMPVVHGEDAFVHVGDIDDEGIYTWNVTQGQRPLLRWTKELRHAGNFGTDGHDMVWTYVEGKGDQLHGTPSTWVMTAPYDTDAASLWSKARKLHLDWAGIGLYRWSVGHGYTARKAGPNLAIIRLSDGRWWDIPGTTNDPTPGRMQFSNVLAVTEDSVYVTAALHQFGRLLRFRIDSLGPGHPASEGGM